MSLLMVSSAALAAEGWVGGLGYSQMSYEAENQSDIELGIATASIGYKFETDDKFYLIPEFRIGTGISSHGEDLSTFFGSVNV